MCFGARIHVEELASSKYELPVQKEMQLNEDVLKVSGNLKVVSHLVEQLEAVLGSKLREN